MSLPQIKDLGLVFDENAKALPFIGAAKGDEFQLIHFSTFPTWLSISIVITPDSHGQHVASRSPPLALASARPAWPNPARGK
jgi:hypothetical protein